MSLNKDSIKKKIKAFDLKNIFIEDLGWDKFSRDDIEIKINNRRFLFKPVSEKRGLAVFQCEINSDEEFPDYSLRRKLEQQITKHYFEHLIIFTDSDRTRQVWQWVKREPGKPAACREHSYYSNQSGEALIQKLENLFVSLEDEETLTLSAALGRVKGAFDVEKVTKKFYERFQKEHESFAKFIKGIPDTEIKKWYVSIMMNRLMFIYFIQKKNFLNSDNDYLRKKLSEMEKKGDNLFYKDFLSKLFFAGFAKKEDERNADEKKLLGKIPYLNGGLFLKHQIESDHEKIEIADEAFEKILNFFEQYNWHLDERPLKSDNEINPDVLGYIFEKYINQKQMGAYYTKEDITEYISKNTIIPFIFDEAKKECSIAFRKGSATWKLLKDEPDRYIYDAVKHGTQLEVPEEIAAGLDTAKPNLLERRKNWNKSAPEEFALPTEIWREVIDRRKRYEEVKSKILNGDITEINDFITYNLNIRQFAQDVIENSEGPELIRAFFKAIQNVSVLDPTCGSGAFLFAALNILEPMYEACIERMEIFVDEVSAADAKAKDSTQRRRDTEESKGKIITSDKNENIKKFRSDKFSDFKSVLKEIEEHASKKYYIYKKIILNNLYGVDIMHEAVEIAKLRLFLKLVAQIENVNDLEPLPDIDFNLKSGNTLVGYAKFEDVEKSLKFKQQTIDTDYDKVAADIKEKAEMVSMADKRFKEIQQKKGSDTKAMGKAKAELTSRLAELNEELNQYLARDYGKLPTIEKSYNKWKESHQPFHWFTEFYDIVQNKGGFDVIIGNPPYVEYTKVKSEYTIKNYQTESCGNLYAFCVERSYFTLRSNGRFGMIIPLSSISTERMEILCSMICDEKSWVSNYAERPCKLFEGAEVQLSIIISQIKKNFKFFSTNYIKWYEQSRKVLFNVINYSSLNHIYFPYSIQKNGNIIENTILEKIFRDKNKLKKYFRGFGKFKLYFKTSGGRYWKVITNFETKYFINNKKTVSSKEKIIPIETEELRNTLVCLLNSNLFWFFYTSFSNLRDLPISVLESFPFNYSEVIHLKLKDTLYELMEDLNHNSVMFEEEKKNIGITKFQKFNVSKSKSIIDAIDKVLAEHYGFTEEELDFIINYDIKYRMGRE